jgi:RNA polymerase sigma-70 factor (ECF subfamily)
MSEEEMIIAIKSGGRQQELALQALYRKSSEFRRHFRFKGLSLEMAEDLVQETVVKIFRSASTYAGGNGFGDSSANAWMWTIAKNVMKDHLRIKRPEDLSLDDDSMADAAKLALEVELASSNPHATHEETVQNCVMQGIEVFAADHPDRAKVLEMQLDGEDIASIARRIGRSVAAAKEYLSQCKKKLAPFIEHCTALLKP